MFERIHLKGILDSFDVLILDNGYEIMASGDTQFYLLTCNKSFVYSHANLAMVLNRYTRLVCSEASQPYEIVNG